MEPPCTMISALVKNTDTAVIKVRVTRIWKSFNPHDKKLLHTNVILMDQEGNHIWAMVRNTQTTYLKALEEDGVYIISRVIVVDAPKKFRSVNRDVSINFFHKTRFEKIADTGVIPKYRFELQDFETIPNLIGDVTSFIDVIGWVVSYGDFETTQRGFKKLEIELLDNRQDSMIVTLWGEKGPKFMNELEKMKEVPVFAVITGLQAKSYFGGLSLSPGDGTMFFFNIDYEPLNDLKAAILDATGHSLQTLPPPKHKPQTKVLDSDVVQASVQTILDMKVPPGKKFARCTCQAKIIDIVQDNDWCYNSCPTCNRTLYLVDGNYQCRACTGPPSAIKQAYKVSVVVEDDTGSTIFTLFNKDAELLIGIPIEKVISEMDEAQPMNEIPAVINNMVGKLCNFELKVTTFNIDRRVEDYGVTKISQCEQTPKAKEQDPETSTSAAKRHKTN